MKNLQGRTTIKIRKNLQLCNCESKRDYHRKQSKAIGISFVIE